MAKFQIKNVAQLRASNNLQLRWVGAALDSVATGLDQIMAKMGVSSDQSSVAPPSINSLSVAAANGVADCIITDNNSLYRAIRYFVEYSTDPAFGVESTHIVSLGASRNVRIPVFMGATLVYFRAYSQYQDSAASAPVNFGAPDGVATGGAGPSLGTGQLAGTATATGQGSGNDVARVNAGIEAVL